jgi:hypothetical protein
MSNPAPKGNQRLLIFLGFREPEVRDAVTPKSLVTPIPEFLKYEFVQDPTAIGPLR